MTDAKEVLFREDGKPDETWDVCVAGPTGPPEGAVYELCEVESRVYPDSSYSAGMVEGHPDDTIYLKYERDDEESEWLVLLRRDEAAAILWVLSAALWSTLVDEVGEDEQGIHDVTEEGKCLNP